VSTDDKKQEEPEAVAIGVRMGKARALPFRVYYADHISTRSGPHGMVQMTFYYVPVLDELFDAVTPGGAAPSQPVTAEACVAAQVVVPGDAFESWFRELAQSRGLLAQADEESEDNG